MVLEDYFFLDRIGTGTFGSVFRARHYVTNQIVAIKIISKEDPEILAAVRNEVDIYSKMDHPLIAQFYNEFETDENIFIVQECAAGGSFLNFVNRTHGLSETQSRFYFMQLLSVVEYLHTTMHVVHRDFKMENLLLDSHNNLRLIDFGLSEKLTHDNQELRDPCGTPAYAAPEVIQRKPYGYQIDIWGLGVLLYAMSVGRLPFYNEDITTLVKMIVYDELTFPDRISPLLRDLIQKLMKKNPAERIKLSEIREHEWLRDAKCKRDLDSLKVTGIVDRDLMKIMQQEMQLDVTSLPDDIEANRINQATAVYKILKKKRITEDLNYLQRPEKDIPALLSMGSGVPRLFSSSDVTITKPVARKVKGRPNSQTGRCVTSNPRGIDNVIQTVRVLSVLNTEIPEKKALPIVYATAVLINSIESFRYIDNVC